jgi:hypothetical protein
MDGRIALLAIVFAAAAAVGCRGGGPGPDTPCARAAAVA